MGTEVGAKKIEKVLSCFEQDGRVRHTTEVEEGLMVWPVQQEPEDSSPALPRACTYYGGTLGAVVWAKPSGFCNIGTNYALDESLV